MRTPITAILCWAQALKNKISDLEVINKGLHVIEENVLIQKCLIDDLLDISSIILGKIAIELKSINLIDVMRLSLESVQPEAETKQIDIVFETNYTEIIALLDAARMRQVFNNLLTNAIKFTSSQGKIEVKIEKKNDGIQIDVKDSGRGIAPELLPHIFNRFTQGASAVFQSEGAGLGLGLAIVRGLLELQGGTVRASSLGLGKGATFTILLPMFDL